LYDPAVRHSDLHLICAHPVPAKELRRLATDTATVEVKAAVGKLPKELGETLSAFSKRVRWCRHSRLVRGGQVHSSAWLSGRTETRSLDSAVMLWTRRYGLTSRSFPSREQRLST